MNKKEMLISVRVRISSSISLYLRQMSVHLILILQVPIPDEEKNLSEIFIFTFLCSASKDFMKALKAFIKPFEVSQSVIIKVKFNLIFISIQLSEMHGTERVKSNKASSNSSNGNSRRDDSSSNTVVKLTSIVESLILQLIFKMCYTGSNLIYSRQIQANSR